MTLNMHFLTAWFYNNAMITNTQVDRACNEFNGVFCNKKMSENTLLSKNRNRCERHETKHFGKRN